MLTAADVATIECPVCGELMLLVETPPAGTAPGWKTALSAQDKMDRDLAKLRAAAPQATPVLEEVALAATPIMVVARAAVVTKKATGDETTGRVAKMLKAAGTAAKKRA